MHTHVMISEIAGKKLRTFVVLLCVAPTFPTFVLRCASLCVAVCSPCRIALSALCGWAEARIKIARMTLTIKLDRNWSSFQLANSAPPLSVTDSAIAPSARMNQVALVVHPVQVGRTFS